MNRLYFGDNLKWLSDRKEYPFKNGVGVEIEWNNKTEFCDRDLNKMDLRMRWR